jgi:hypothetical protein
LSRGKDDLSSADDFEGFLSVVSSPAKFPSVVEKVRESVNYISIKYFG